MKFKYLIIFCIFSSCQFLSSTKKDTQQQIIDTIMDFSKVDASPSFIECKDKIDAERLACFRATIHKKLSKNLSTHQIKVKDSIDEIIKVYLSINSKGTISLKEVAFSKDIKAQIPNLDSLIQASVNELPKVSPAIKRSIPVSTQYELPIRIWFKK